MNTFMKTAILEANSGVKKRHGGPFGAVLVRKGKIISLAHNTVIKDQDPTCHAEINSIRKAARILKRFDLSDCEIYTTCEPCPMCYGAIRWAKIRKVFFGCDRFDAAKIGFDDKSIYDELSVKRSKGKLLRKQISRDECIKVFDRWRMDKKRKRY